MANEIAPISQSDNQIVRHLYWAKSKYQPNETLTLEVKIDDALNTVWLSIDQMAELFGRDKSVIGKHVRACFKEGELKKESVWAKFAYTAKDGKTIVSRVREVLSLEFVQHFDTLWVRY